jgi:hypothetical protein
MSDFVGMMDQSEIDAFVRKAKLAEDCKSAKEKVKIIYESALGENTFYSELNTLDEIGSVIDDIDNSIQGDNEYYLDFARLKSSYEFKRNIG